jgi:hypothetical protein
MDATYPFSVPNGWYVPIQCTLSSALIFAEEIGRPPRGTGDRATRTNACLFLTETFSK